MSQLLYRLITSDHFSDDPFLVVAYLAYEEIPLKLLSYELAPLTREHGLQPVRQTNRSPSLSLHKASRVQLSGDRVLPASTMPLTRKYRGYGVCSFGGVHFRAVRAIGAWSSLGTAFLSP